MGRVKDTDKGFMALVRSVDAISNESVRAGVLSDAGAAADGTSYIDIAYWQEYGTKNIPKRPFMRIAADKNQKAWSDLASDVAGRVAAGRLAPKQGLDLIGLKMAGDIQQVIGNKSLLARNAPGTIKQKGSDAPLIDTGSLRQRIHHRRGR